MSTKKKLSSIQVALKDLILNKFSVITIVLITIVIYAYFNPEEHLFFPKCPFFQLTGLKCPGCGSQRAIHQLLNGNFTMAFHHNAFLMILMPWLCAITVCQFSISSRLKETRNKLLHKWIVNLYVVLLILWWILRNTLFLM